MCESGWDIAQQEKMDYDLEAKIAVKKCVHIRIFPSH